MRYYYDTPDDQRWEADFIYMVHDSGDKYMHLLRFENRCYLMLATLGQDADTLLKFDDDKFNCEKLIKYGNSYFVSGEWRNRYQLCRVTGKSLNWCKKMAIGVEVNHIETYLFNDHIYVRSTSEKAANEFRFRLVKFTLDGEKVYVLQFGNPANFYSVGLHFTNGLIYCVYYNEETKKLGVFTISEDGYNGPKGVNL